MGSRAVRRKFGAELVKGFQVVWPILSGLLTLITAGGVVVGRIEGWNLRDSIYFALVTAMTIGYGDFAPKAFMTRALAVFIGACGLVMTALIAAITVKALAVATNDNKSGL